MKYSLGFFCSVFCDLRLLAWLFHVDFILLRHDELSEAVNSSYDVGIDRF
jgi:hypothetical protein